MLECSICRRLYDGRFKVFVPPYQEAFDTVECARRAARAWVVDPAAAPIPVILPTIEAVGARPKAPAPVVGGRRKAAVLAALALAPGQAALAGGVGLAAAGTAASIYLLARPAGDGSKTSHIAAGVPKTLPTPTSPLASPGGPSGAGPHETRPATKAISPARPARNATPRTAPEPGTGNGHSLGTTPGRSAGSTPSASEAKFSVHHPSTAPTVRPSTSSPSPSAGHHPPVAPKPTPPAPTTSPEPRPAGQGTILVAASAPATTETSSRRQLLRRLQATSKASKAKKQEKQGDPGHDKGAPDSGKSKKPADPPADHGKDATQKGARPGNGNGDKNHDHTGPPGQKTDNPATDQSNGDGGGKDKGKDGGKDQSNGSGKDQGGGDGKDNGHGDGKDHAH